MPKLNEYIGATIVRAPLLYCANRQQFTVALKITTPHTTNQYVITIPGDQFFMSSSTKENQIHGNIIIINHQHTAKTITITKKYLDQRAIIRSAGLEESKF